MKEKTVKPVGYIESDFKEKFGIPRQSGRVNSVGKIKFYPPFDDEKAFIGIEEFNYIWVIFDFSETPQGKFCPTVRPPRLGGNIKKGVFATRSPFRPNGIGLSCVKLLKIEKENGKISLVISGGDFLDGTPVLDVKPYIPYADCRTDAEGGFADEKKDYNLQINFAEEFLKLIPEEKRAALTGALSDDPRPAYHKDGRVYGMKFDEFNVKFTVKEGILTVCGVEKLP